MQIVILAGLWCIERDGHVIAACTSRGAVEAAWRLLAPDLPAPTTSA